MADAKPENPEDCSAWPRTRRRWNSSNSFIEERGLPLTKFQR
jgi:hypothetical protein